MNAPIPKPQLLKPHQTTILVLLYRFRFLNRRHIQTLLHHSYRSRVISWLNDLTEQNYLIRYYAKSLKNDPAVYSLGSEGRKYLKRNAAELKVQPELLERARREKALSEAFRGRCLQVADIALSLESLAAAGGATLHLYTRTDLSGVPHVPPSEPDLYFALEERDGRVGRYFLDVFGNVAAKVLRSRVRTYFEHAGSGTWQERTGKPYPKVLLICPDKRLQKHLIFYIQNKLEAESDPEFFLSTAEEVRERGLVKGVLRKVIAKG